MHSDRILILDDEPLTGQTIRSIAEFAGMQARHTTDPDEFFQLVQEWRPGHIALDLIMPDMDGVQVMIRLAELNCRARIIITSGVGTRVLDAAARSAAEHGLRIAGVLAKPFSPPRLRELLFASDTDAEYNSEQKLEQPATRKTQEDMPPPAADTQFSHQDLVRALDNDELFVVYQPKLHCRTGILTGFEALVRWQHPARGVVTPDSFIPLAEQSELIDQLTLRVLEKSLSWLHQLPRSVAESSGDPYLSWRMESVTLSLNISAASLNNLTLFDQLDECCQAWGIRRDRLILELTETSAMEDPIASLDMLTRVRMRGYHLSIDDFGTGYSSMLQLARLPFSEIKVDKSFVMTAEESEESRTVIRSIIELGHGLGLQATAEGIETEETLAYLTSVGCDLAQGYHIARPMTEQQTLEWLIERSHNNEESRLSVLHAMNLLDTPEEERYDRITRLACRLFGVQTTLLSLVDTDRQWFKSVQGLRIRETHRDASFCSHAIDQTGTMIVNDASQDPRFAGNPLVTGFPHIRFYAGAPIHASNGSKLGTLCLIDPEPGVLSDSETRLLEKLAGLLEAELDDEPGKITDRLTGLMNRKGFEKRAGQLLELCNHFGLSADLLFLDIDHFKKHNSVHGPQSGDRFLDSFSRLFRDAFSEADLISRFGSDEFVVLLVGQPPEAIKDMLNTLRRHFNASQTDSRIGLDFSTGHSTLDSETHDDLQQLLARADRDMYAARAAAGDDE
ncbi:MAG: EAL domain-containing protein [Pseudohongiellaceae bacterium]